MPRGTVCSHAGTYGSVGALGGQPPRATRQFAILLTNSGLAQMTSMGTGFPNPRLAQLTYADNVGHVKRTDYGFSPGWCDLRTRRTLTPFCPVSSRQSLDPDVSD